MQQFFEVFFDEYAMFFYITDNSRCFNRSPDLAACSVASSLSMFELGVASPKPSHDRVYISGFTPTLISILVSSHTDRHYVIYSFVRPAVGGEMHGCQERIKPRCSKLPVGPNGKYCGDHTPASLGAKQGKCGGRGSRLFPRIAKHSFPPKNVIMAQSPLTQNWK